MWKLREFNELNHFFERRIAVAKTYTNFYMDQFPREITSQLARFVVFVAGSLLAVLAIATVMDSEELIGFEIAGRTTIFWLGGLGAVWNIARGMVPDEDAIQDPEHWIEQVIQFTHYKPKSWEGKLYSEEVLTDMSKLYKVELLLFLQEIASIIFVPFIFWYSLPNCAEQLVDFFREFTIHVDGMGYVCSFAMFDFKSNGNQVAPRAAQNPGELRADYFGARDNKLAESYNNFWELYKDVPRQGQTGRNMRGQFRLPPPFPGLAASRLHQNLGQSMHYTPRMGPTASITHGTGASPMHSVLLDPHHQPRGSHRSPQQGPTLRQRGIGASRLQTLDGDPDEHDEEDVRPVPRRTPSNILEEDSDLGDSWAVKADAGLKSSGNNGASKKADNEGIGVLGLLHQFQKVQTEGRAGNI